MTRGHRQLPDLGVQRFHVHGRLAHSVASARTEHIGSLAFKLSLPRRDLIGVDVELLGRLSQRSIALHGGQRHLRLEGRCVVPARSSAHCRSRFAGIACPLSGRNSTYRPCAEL